MHWGPSSGANGEADRDRLIHTIGNLTLLTGKLNTKVSNGPWLGTRGKREGLEDHDVLLLNRELLRKAGDAWTDEKIRSRTDEIAKIVIAIWRVPEGHRSGVSDEKPRLRRKVDLAELINAKLLEPGMPLFPRQRKFAERVVTLLPDGRVDVDGIAFPTPSSAAVSMKDKPTNGWWFFLVDQESRRSLGRVRREYIDTLPVDVEDEEGDDEDDDDES